MEFVPGSLLEARDFNNEWFSAKVVEVDLDDREVLVHFQNWSSRYDEWISMDSARLRPVSQNPEQVAPSKNGRGKDFKVGEKVMAAWNNNRKYPAQIQRVLDGGNFEVIFYDGFVMQVKAKQISRLPKEQAEKLEIPSSVASVGHGTGPPSTGPAGPEIGSKEERRKRKKILEVASLFRSYKKRPSTDGARPADDVDDVGGGSASPLMLTDVGASPTPAAQPPLPPPPPSVEVKRKAPIKERETVKLNDTKLPAGWEKRAKLKMCGTKAGKWDVVIIGPEGRTFRSRQDIKQYLLQHRLNYDLELFDFRLGEEFYRERGIEPPKRAKDDYVAPALLKQFLRAEAAAAAAAAAATAASSSSSSSSSSFPSTASSSTSVLASVAASASAGTAGAGAATFPPAAGAGDAGDAPTFAPEHDGYRCPLDDCRKLFRRDNLLLMHIKHYHPALLKKLGCKTLRVEDLATARTAFETDDIKPQVYAQSILSALLTPPPAPAAGVSSPSAVLGATPSAATPLLDDVPLAKRLSASASTSASASHQVGQGASTTPVLRPSRRRSERSAGALTADADANDAGTAECGIAAAIDAVLAECDKADQLDALETDAPLQTDEGTPVTTVMLDDIPGQKELVHCFCGLAEEDGLMIQCELCLCWQHGICLGIDTEQAVPDPYVCHFCRYPYRERLSQRYTHDQAWLNKALLPGLKFLPSVGAAGVVPGGKTLSTANALTAATSDLKQLLHSLKVKIDIAKNKDHHKLYLWAQPWSNEDPAPVADEQPSLDLASDEFKPLVPNIPLPEAPINAVDCRLNLLAHIHDMQDEVDARLETLESLFAECEEEDGPIGEASYATRLQLLLKDVLTLKRMSSFTWNA